MFEDPEPHAFTLISHSVKAGHTFNFLQVKVRFTHTQFIFPMLCIIVSLLDSAMYRPGAVRAVVLTYVSLPRLTPLAAVVHILRPLLIYTGATVIVRESPAFANWMREMWCSVLGI